MKFVCQCVLVRVACEAFYLEQVSFFFVEVVVRTLKDVGQVNVEGPFIRMSPVDVALIKFCIVLL